jgi:hypothetical protein
LGRGGHWVVHTLHSTGHPLGDFSPALWSLSESISFTGVLQGIPKYKIWLGRGKNGRVGVGLVGATGDAEEGGGGLAWPNYRVHGTSCDASIADCKGAAGNPDDACRLSQAFNTSSGVPRGLVDLERSTDGNTGLGREVSTQRCQRLPWLHDCSCTPGSAVIMIGE